MSASANRERFLAWVRTARPEDMHMEGAWQAALSAGQATEPVGFIKEATEALLVEILDDDCDDLQSVRAIARTLRAAGQVIPEPVAREDFNKMSDDLTRAKNLLVRLHAKHPEARAQIEGSTGSWFIWGVDRGASPPVEVGVTVEAIVLNALNSAKMFIRNGVEMGYIRMPEADCPDPAHQTPKLIEAAIEALCAASPLPAPVEPPALLQMTENEVAEYGALCVMNRRRNLTPREALREYFDEHPDAAVRNPKRPA